MNNPSFSDAIAKIIKTVRSCNTRTQLEHAYTWGREWLCKKRSEIGAARFSNYMEIVSYVYRMRSFQLWEGGN